MRENCRSIAAPLPQQVYARAPIKHYRHLMVQKGLRPRNDDNALNGPFSALIIELPRVPLAAVLVDAPHGQLVQGPDLTSDDARRKGKRGRDEWTQESHAFAHSLLEMIGTGLKGSTYHEDSQQISLCIRCIGRS
jgi:hypothetical protein